MTRNALLIEITPEDEAWAIQQNRYNCAVVRCIQRKIPSAIFVRADAKEIAWTMPDDQLKDAPLPGVRYKADPPPADLLREFDLHHIIPEEHRTFSVIVREAKPMQHKKPGTGNKERRTKQRQNPRTRSKSQNLANTNRFLDAESQG